MFSNIRYSCSLSTFQVVRASPNNPKAIL